MTKHISTRFGWCDKESPGVRPAPLVEGCGYQGQARTCAGVINTGHLPRECPHGHLEQQVVVWVGAVSLDQRDHVQPGTRAEHILIATS